MSIPVERLTIAWKNDFDIDIQPELGDVQTIQFCECWLCRLRYFVPGHLTGSARLYAALEKQDWYYMPRKWEHDVALEDLHGARTVLEIGCGTGDFIARLRKNVGLEAEGIELNDSAVKIAQGRGLPVRLQPLGEAAIQFARHYDAVCSFQVLEHISNPREFLRWACTLVRSGGKLLIGLPNADSFLKHQFNLLDMPPHHLTRWSAETLAYLPKLLPLRLIRLRREPLAEYHVTEYVNAYFKAYTRRGVARLFNRGTLKKLASTFIRRTGIRKSLTGHTIYAAFERV